MDLNEILVFTKVVQAGSFTGASRDLAMPKSTVSRKVSDLEERLGARLLHRTTRKLGLTDVGLAYYQHCARIVTELEEAELAVTRLQTEPRGVLRVTAPLNFQFLGPIVSEYLCRHEQVQIDLVCSDGLVDLVEEGFDVAIRIGRLADSSLFARKLGTTQRLMVASPAYLERKGMPRSPADLKSHDGILFGPADESDGWRLQEGKKPLSAPVVRRIRTNDFEILHGAVLAGLGIAMLPAFSCIEDIRSGRMRRVLPNHCSPEAPLHAIYPSTRHLSPKVKAFVDLLSERMNPPPWKRGPAA